MQAALQTSHYFSPDIYALEQQRLFSRLWIFACLKTALGADQAYATRSIGGRPVLIQNTGGRIRAFENACAHRLMPLHSEAFGQGRLVCPYHGWVFDEAGAVKTIPKAETLYQFCEAQRQELRLKEYAVQVLGNLVFVNLDPAPLPIEQQFSPDLIAQLQAISSHFGEVSVHVDIPTRYNWKLNFENVLDHQHVPYVHPKSFQPLIRAAQTEPAATAVPNVPDHPAPSDRLVDQSWASTTPMQIAHWPWHDQVERYGPPDTYHNHFLFPNVNFISVGGLVFLVQQFDPVSPTQTQVRFTLCTARPTGRLPALPAILRGHLKSEVEVLMEDVAHLERLQAGLHAGSPPVHHGRYEHALVGFGRVYRRWLEEARPC
jgi:phenylpropionate dioxygenase-like ring-hydroxylating dioxygenase large terminal subunit